MADKLHGRIIQEGSQFRAEHWLVNGADGKRSTHHEAKLFSSQEDARIWLEQQSHALGYDRIWLDHDTSDLGPLLSP